MVEQGPPKPLAWVRFLQLLPSYVAVPERLRNELQIHDM